MKVTIKTNSYNVIQWEEITNLLLLISEEDDEGYCHNTLVKDGWVSVSPYIGAGDAKWISDEEIHYRTGSGKGYYILKKDGTIIFEGYRNSFISGTEFFYCGKEKVYFHSWSTIEMDILNYEYESSDMSRDPWHRREIVEEDVVEPIITTGRRVKVKRVSL